MSGAHLPSRLEPTGLSLSGGKYPDGITLVPWRSGRLLEWDATCPDRHICLLPSTIATREAWDSGSPGWAEQAGGVHSPQPMPLFHTGGHQTGWPFGGRDFIILERSGLLSQTGHWGSQVVHLPAATPVCRSAMGKCLCNVGNNERHHSPFSFPFLTFFPFWGGGALSASPLTACFSLCTLSHIIRLINHWTIWYYYMHSIHLLVEYGRYKSYQPPSSPNHSLQWNGLPKLISTRTLQAEVLLPP